MKIEKSADAQLGRSFEFALPKEWSRQEQIQYTADYIQKTFVDKGMCADWSIHDKGDGNPHVHLLLTMRPFNPDHSWGKKEVKDWDFVRDKNGNIVIDESHPNWWQDKKNPDRHGIRIPVLDENRNSEDWSKKPPAMETGADRCYWMEQSKKSVNCGGVNGQRCVTNICLCIIRLITVLMKSRENSRFLPSMKELTQERLNKSFLPGRK